jgi:hypothetical protein
MKKHAQNKVQPTFCKKVTPNLFCKRGSTNIWTAYVSDKKMTEVNNCPNGRNKYTLVALLSTPLATAPMFTLRIPVPR